jgi:hypothetical protein
LYRKCFAPTLAGLIYLLLFYISPSFAQDTQGRYQRKSISFVDAVLPLGEVHLSERQQSYLLQQIKSEIEMSRFDYNPLPDALISDFREALHRDNVRDLDAITQALDSALVPEIVHILDYEKEMRARGLVSEAERHSFIVDKAKESGVTEADLWAVMNSAYIYLPVLYRANVEQDWNSGSASANLEGGMLWFKVTASDSESAVKLLARKTAVGYGWTRLEDRRGRRERDLSGAEYAFTTAAETFARNLRIATQQIPDFQLTNPLTQTGPGWVEFSLGRDEGVGVDDKFIIAEFEQQPDSTLRQHQLGMVRVTHVGTTNDGSNDSRARDVMGAGFQPGMVALEHPRLPLDLSFRVALLPVHVTAGHFDQGYFSNTNDLNFSRNSTSTLFAGQLWFNYNLARTTHWPQFFASFYGEIGSGKLSGGSAYDNPLPVGFYWGLGGGLVKKFYVNRFHLGLEALASYAHYQVSGTTDLNNQSNSWQWKIANLGLTLNGNLEIALGYDLNLGAGVSYRSFASQDNWNYTYDGAALDLSHVTGLPKLSFGGWGGQMYLTWSLPTLGVDPVKLLGGLFGH